MEKPLDKHLDDLMSAPGVTGVVCADSQGLCLGVRGEARITEAGQISGVSQQALNLHPDLKDEPVVCIDSDLGSVLIKSQAGVTLGIHKSAT